MSKKKYHRSTKTINKGGFLIWMVQLLAEGWAFLTLLRLNMFPGYFLAVIGAVLLFLLFGIFRTIPVYGFKWTKLWMEILATIMSVIIICVSIISSFAMDRLLHTVSSITQNVTPGNVVGVYVLKDSDIFVLRGAKDEIFGYSSIYDVNNTNIAIGAIEMELDQQINTKELRSITDMADALNHREINAMIINASYLAMLDECEGYESFSDNVREVYQYTVHEATAEYKEDPKERKTITNSPFVIYLSGNDTRSKELARSRSDVNILVVVNPVTKQFLMINTPRDYYIPNPQGNGEPDKLTHCGLYGTGCSMQALGDLYGINVDYYAQINFTGFQTLIDSIGGISVVNDVDFYADGINFKKGKITLNGEKALAYARERYSFKDGDNVRGQHQMLILKSVISKISNARIILSNYTSILDSLSGMFVTNVTTEDITNLVKLQIEDLAKWNIKSFAVTGTGGKAKTYSMPDYQAYVMYPDEKMVKKAANLMQKVLDGDTITDEDVK